MHENAALTWLLPFADELLQGHQCAVDQSPEYEIPACAMPQTCAKKYNPFVENRAGSTFAVAAKRDVQIIAKPSGQRDMPAFPEFRNGA